MLIRRVIANHADTKKGLLDVVAKRHCVSWPQLIRGAVPQIPESKDQKVQRDGNQGSGGE